MSATDRSTAPIPGGALEVTQRYDELARFVASFAARPLADAGVTQIAALALAHEARLLDARELARWLDLWHPDGVFWVPLRADAAPSHDQSLLLDDVRRLRERVSWHHGPWTWAQRPPSATVRHVGTVEAWLDDGGWIDARSTIAIAEQRGGRVETHVAVQLHRFAAATAHDARTLHTKVLLMPRLASGTPSLGFLL